MDFSEVFGVKEIFELSPPPPLDDEPPPPEPFAPIVEPLQEEVELENEEVVQVTVGLGSMTVQSEANPSTSTQSNLAPLPDSLTILQNPPDMQQNPQANLPNGQEDQNMLNYFQEQDFSAMNQQTSLGNGQPDHHYVLNQNMPNPFQELDVYTMQHQQTSLSNEQPDQQYVLNQNISNLYQELDASTMEHQQTSLANGQQYDQQYVLNQNMSNPFQELDVSTMEQPPFSSGYLQENLQNRQAYQQFLSNQNIMNNFQEPNHSTMEGNNVYAHPTMTQSNVLPNQFQEQFSPVNNLAQSYPSFQQGSSSSNINMCDQQHYMTPIVTSNMACAPINPSMATNSSRTYPQQNQISTNSPSPRQISSIPTRPPLHRVQRKAQESVYQPSTTTTTTRSRYRDFDLYRQLRPPTNSFSTPQQTRPMERGESSSSSAARRRRTTLSNNNVGSAAANLVPGRTNPQDYQINMPQIMSNSTRPQGNTNAQINQSTNSFTPQQDSVLGRREERNRDHYDPAESSSARRRRITMPNDNIPPSAPNRVPERIQNGLYDPAFESLGLYIDPHLRKFHRQE